MIEGEIWGWEPLYFTRKDWCGQAFHEIRWSWRQKREIWGSFVSLIFNGFHFHVYFQVAASRLLSFGRYIFNVSSYPIVEKLFASEKFLAGARSTCPNHKQVLDPFQFNFIIQAGNSYLIFKIFVSKVISSSHISPFIATGNVSGEDSM